MSPPPTCAICDTAAGAMLPSAVTVAELFATMLGPQNIANNSHHR